MTVEHGSVRQIWIAPSSNPSDKHSFLIRDDAHSKRGATFGRSVRLGDPVSLGPQSTWRQLSWEGGSKQETWKDGAMFASGNVDTWSERGKLQQAAGWKEIASGVGGSFRFSTGATGFGADTPLWVGCSRWPDGPVVSLYNLFQYNPVTQALTLKFQATTPINALCRHNDLASPQNWIAFGTDGGVLYIINEATGQVIDERAVNGVPGGPPGGPQPAMQPIGIDTLAAFGESLYWGAGNELWRRTADFVAGAKYEKVKAIPNCFAIRGMAVWNERLWFTTLTSGAKTRVWLTDGTTTRTAFDIAGDFTPTALVAHSGSLYVVGNRPGHEWNTGQVGQIWRYNGATLSLLYEEGTGYDFQDHGIYAATSFGKFLAWTSNKTSTQPGVMLYDPEMDAIHTGPTWETSAAGSRVSSIVWWSNTLAVSTFPHPTAPTLTSALLMRERGIKRGSFGAGWAPDANHTRILTSSEYDGELPGENKVFYRARVRAKLDGFGARMSFQVSADDGGWVNVFTVSGSQPFGSGVWANFEGQIRYLSAPLKCMKIRYRLVLENTAGGGDFDNVTVNGVEVDFMPAPQRRRQWQLRVVTSDGQKRLDSSANPLSTKAALQSKIEDWFASGQPLLFWSARSTTENPASGQVEVFCTDWLEQDYRLDTAGTEEAGEVSLTFVEVA